MHDTEIKYRGETFGGSVKRRVYCLLNVAVVAIGAVAGHTNARGLAADWLLPVSPLVSPAGPNSAQPQLSVTGDRVVLSWIERTGATAMLKFAERTDNGWTDARSVASGDNYFVNWADVPSVIRLQDGSLAAHWLQKSADSTYAYDVRLAFSKDEGRSWSASTTPHHDGTTTEHGFASLFQMPGAGLGLVWLDGRQMKDGSHEGMNAGSMTIRGAVFNANGAQVSEALIDDSVCECCPTTAAVTSDGPIVAYRDRTKDEIRDIYVSRLTGGKWTQPVAVHRDNWRINACPVNGPALSARGRDVAIAWFTAQGEEGHVYASFSQDAGQTFGAPIRIDDVGAVGRVDAELLPDGSTAVSWIEFADQRAQFRIRRIERTGVKSASIAVAGIAAGRASGYPRVVGRQNELVFAWTETGEQPHVRTAVARLGAIATTADR
jgi:hypothetical protein